MSAATVIELARRGGLTIGTAESLTGGALAAALTAVPGAGDSFAGGIVSYHNAVKHRVLGVSEDLLDDPGPVSSQVAQAMAAGARRTLGVDIAVATTGVAGPTELDGQPPGTAWIGLAGPAGLDSHLVQVHGDRAQVQAAVVEKAVELLGDAVKAAVSAGEHN